MRKSALFIVGLLLLGIVAATWYGLLAPDDVPASQATKNSGVAPGVTGGESAKVGVLPPVATAGEVAAGGQTAEPLVRTTEGPWTPQAATKRGNVPDAVRNRIPMPKRLSEPSAMTSALISGQDYAKLYAQALDGPQTPEALFTQAQLLSRCANRPQLPGVTQLTLAERRQTFVAGLNPNDPDHALRVAAFDNFTADLCGSLKEIPYSAQEVQALYNKAAELGDAAARSRAISCELANQTRLAGAQAPALSEAQLTELKALLGSKNPLAIRTAVGLLANNYRNFALGIGSATQRIDNRALFNTAELLACQYGATCDGKNRVLLQACAQQGQCNAANYAEHVSIYDTNNEQARLIEQYRAALTQMIEANNFGGLNIIRREQDAPTQAYFGSDFQCN